MKKRFWCLIISVMLINILVSACSKKMLKEDENVVIGDMNKNQVEDESDNKLATIKLIMEMFEVTEEDLEGIPVEDILLYFHITEADLIIIKEELINPSDITNYLKLSLKEMNEEKKIKEEYGTIDYTYILEAKEYEGEFPDIESIRYLVDAYNIADGGYSCVIDFEKNKIYYNPDSAWVYNDIRFTENVIDLTPEIKEEIISLLKEVKLGEWEYKYDAYRGEGSVECFWEFGVEFNDGTIVSNYGTYGDSPNEYVTLRDELYDKILKNY